MKNFFILLFLSVSLSSFGQKFVIKIDTVQKFTHDSSLSTTSAVNLNKISYLNGSTTNLKFTFDLDKMEMYRQYNDETVNLLKIISIVKSTNNIMEVYVLFDDGVRNYIITKNLEQPNKYIFLSRTLEDGIVSGWFDPNIEIKKETI
jgi:hypothetical protein